MHGDTGKSDNDSKTEGRAAERASAEATHRHTQGKVSIYIYIYHNANKMVDGGTGSKEGEEGEGSGKTKPSTAKQESRGPCDARSAIHQTFGEAAQREKHKRGRRNDVSSRFPDFFPLRACLQRVSVLRHAE